MSVEETRFETYEYSEGKLVRKILKRDSSYGISYVPIDGQCDFVSPEDYDLQWLKLKSRPEISSPTKELNMVDLFSGTGPMTLGIVEAGRALNIKVNPVLAIDFESTAALNYKLNFPECNVINDDINTIINGELGSDPTELEAKTIKELGKIDIVIGGPPCQGHSDLNNHTRRDDPRNQLIFKVVRFVELFKPNFVVIENVQGIMHDKKNVLGVAESYLESLGYKIRENLLMASDFGVAQNRRRFILVASKYDLDFNLEPYKRNTRTSSKWALSDLKSSDDKGDIFNTPASHSVVNQERIKYLYDNDIYELPSQLRPKCQQREDNRYTSVYGRMYPDKPAPTITSGFGSIGQGRFGHPFERRTLTPHEAARIQFIPDFFKFSGQLTRVALQKMIGNAVPPKLTYIIGLELFR